MNFFLRVLGFIEWIIIGLIKLPFILVFKLRYWIVEKCPFCKKNSWFWNEREYFEITPDFGLLAHKKCYTKENASRYHEDWFKDIEGEIFTEKPIESASKRRSPTKRWRV